MSGVGFCTWTGIPGVQYCVCCRLLYLDSEYLEFNTVYCVWCVGWTIVPRVHLKLEVQLTGLREHKITWRGLHFIENVV